MNSKGTESDEFVELKRHISRSIPKSKVLRKTICCAQGEVIEALIEAHCGENYKAT